MNVVIDLLNLPCDIKYEIKNYCYDNRGYTYTELDEIEKIKSKQKWYKLRIKIELWYWKNLEVSVSWLRPIYRNGKYLRGCYYGCKQNSYNTILHELRTIKEYKEYKESIM